MNIKDIAKSIRQQLKGEFPRCKFSVSIERYSMGQSMTISLMEAPFDVFVFTKDGRQYSQINQYSLKESDTEYKSEYLELTQRAFKCMKRVVQTTQYFNYDNSDAMTDHFDVNFYLHLAIGKWDKPFIKTGHNIAVTSHYKDKGDEALAKMGLI